MLWLNAVLVLYALLSIGGGIDGFVAKQSMISLMAGCGSGVVVLAAVAFARKNPSVGYAIAAVAILAVTGSFIPRYMKSHGTWPALVMIIAGVIALGSLIAAHFMGKKG